MFKNIIADAQQTETVCLYQIQQFQFISNQDFGVVTEMDAPMDSQLPLRTVSQQGVNDVGKAESDLAKKYRVLQDNW